MSDAQDPADAGMDNPPEAFVTKYADQRFEHDCNVCRFVGQLGREDVWVHERPDGADNTLIRRWGSDGPEYSSLPIEMVGQLPLLHPTGPERDSNILWAAARILVRQQ